MEILKTRILKDGKVKPGNVLKVDSFLNHQMDIRLLEEIGEEFKKRFEGTEINKILTIEASGIGIACMVAKYTDCQIIGLDISRDALNTALDNASRLNLFNKAIFRKSDVFSNVKPGESFDIIISNPPYIPPSKKANIQMEVKFDPELALYTSDEKGLEFYEKISQGAPSILNKGGYLLFELGIDQAKDVEQIMLNNGFKEIEIIKDLAGIDRVIAGKI